VTTKTRIAKKKQGALLKLSSSSALTQITTTTIIKGIQKKEFGADCKYPLQLLEPGRTTLQAGIHWVQTQNHLTKMKKPHPIRSTCFMIFEI